ncbi:MAG: CBS domain-containing protein, partial [Alphaproteobacteria bacterium]|nr:CBS domain-containing protein [Alphaproteobacteria bacterium]
RDPDTGRFVGVVELYDLDQKSRTAAAGKVKNAELIFTQDTNVLEAMEKLKNFVGDAVPVIDTEADTLLGVISEAKIIQAYLNMVNRLRQEEHATL